VSATALHDHLRRLCDVEKIEASDRALRLLARAGEGSVRDAVALLDQLATFGSGRIAEEDAVRLLGGLDLQLFHDLLRAIVNGDAPAVAAALARVEDEGWDPRRTHDQFLAYCRDALHAAVGTDPERLDLPAEDAEQLVGLAKSAGYESLLRLLNQLLKSEELVRRSETPGLAVEIAWLRAAELPKLIRIEELLAAGPASGPGGTPSSSSEGRGARGGATAPAGASRSRGGAAPTGVARPSRGPNAGAPAPQHQAAPRPVAPRPTPVESAPTAAAPPTASADAEAGIAREPASLRLSSDPREALLELVSQRKQSLAAHLRGCQELRFVNGSLEVVIARGDSWLREALDRPQNREILDAAVRQVWGTPGRWHIVEEAATPRVAAPVAASPALMVDHPVVQSALDLFAGTIETIEESPPPEES
jgi:DNA polymerase-3 subunit gamma/tau